MMSAPGGLLPWADMIKRFHEMGMTELEAAQSCVDAAVTAMKGVKPSPPEVSAIIEDLEIVVDHLFGEQFRTQGRPRFSPHNGKQARVFDKSTR